jgi:hypothetical protein
MPASLPAPLRCARLGLPAPGVEVPEHRDTPTGLLCGFVRLHVPISADPGDDMEELAAAVGLRLERWLDREREWMLLRPVR